MSLDPQGCFVGEIDSEVVGSATGIRYDANLGWIGMVLVNPEFRRQGIATKLMNHTIQYLESSPCSCLKLDATDAGAKVYEKMGFVYEYQVERWTGIASGHKFLKPKTTAVRTILPESLNALARWDRDHFGADRTLLLRWYLKSGNPAFYMGNEDSPRGFILGRKGSDAFQIGPLTALDSKTAETLFQTYLAEVQSDPVIVDLVVPNPAAADILREHGFQRFRVLYRMYRGENRSPGHPDNIYCISGFEFG